MKTKICTQCGENKIDNDLNFIPRLKGGGVWGTTARCRDCMGKRRRELRRQHAREALINANFNSQGDSV